MSELEPIDPHEIPFTDSSARFLIPRASGRIIARIVTLMLMLIMTTSSVIYLPATAVVVLAVVVFSVSEGASRLPFGLGRFASQVRVHLGRVTADWLSIAGIMVIALLWNFTTRSRPDWLLAAPVALTAFSFWTSQFASLPSGAMGRWIQFQLRLKREAVCRLFGRTPPDSGLEASSRPAQPPPAPVSPVENSGWHSEQQDRFDDWLSEEIHRFEDRDASRSGSSRQQ